MEKIRYMLAAVSAGLGVLWGRLGVLGPVLALLLAGNVLDWVTGQAAASRTTGLSSHKGQAGIRKKAGYWVAVAGALMVDALLIFVFPGLALAGLTLKITAPVLAPIIATWLVLNEILSILENLGRMGVPLPAWLAQGIEQLKGKVDAAGADALGGQGPGAQA